MKIFVIFILAVCLSTSNGLLTEKSLQVLINYQNDCIRRTGVSEESIEMAKLDRMIHDNKSLSKFSVCMLQRFKIMDDEELINQDVYSYELFSDDPEMYNTATKCRDLTGKDVYESARKIMTCLMKSDIYVLNPLPSRH